MNIKNHQNKNLNIFAFDMFGLKCYFHPYIYHVKAVQNDIPLKTVRLRLCNAVENIFFKRTYSVCPELTKSIYVTLMINSR